MDDEFNKQHMVNFFPSLQLAVKKIPERRYFGQFCTQLTETYTDITLFIFVAYLMLSYDSITTTDIVTLTQKH